jgi:transcriptional regulator with XRE-family HTH domain
MKSKTGKLAEKLSRLITNQSALARQTGLSQSTISEATSGKRRLFFDQVALIARTLGVSLDYLADDSQDEPPQRGGPQDDEVYILRVVRSLGIDADEAVRRLAVEASREED